jgi:hypothetical protein
MAHDVTSERRCESMTEAQTLLMQIVRPSTSRPDRYPCEIFVTNLPPRTSQYA